MQRYGTGRFQPALFLKAQSQLKAIYKDNMDTIIGNMDSTLFLGGKEITTLEEISKMLGKETIDLYNTSITKGTQESHGQNYQKVGREDMPSWMPTPRTCANNVKSPQILSFGH